MRWSFLVLLAACGRVGFDPVEAPNLGQLDPSFGEDGVAYPSSGERGETWDVAVRASGYLINGVAFQGATDVFMDVIALTDAGARDPAFGGEQLLGPVPSSFGYGLTMRPNGGAYFLGDGEISGEMDNFIIGRLTPTGALDRTFGGGGYVDYNIPPTSVGDTAWAAALVADTLYVCGVADYSGDPRFSMIAVRADGTLDPSFATAGMSTTNFTVNGDDQCKDIAYDGTTLVAIGSVDDQIAIMNVDLAGTTIDRMTLMPGVGEGLAIGPDGARVVVASAPGSGSMLLRFVGGALDPAFGTRGVVEDSQLTFRDVVVDSQGRIVAAGHHRSSRPAIARFLADGALDPEFADAGVFMLPFEGGFSSLAIDQRGRIVAGGYDDSGAATQPLVVRLH